MTVLSKAFDCLHYELLIAKLDAYGFGTKPVELIQQYLSNRKQEVKVGNAYTVHGKKCFMEFYRDQSLVRLSSLYFCGTYFNCSKASE